MPLSPFAMSAGVGVPASDILHTPFASLAAWRQEHEECRQLQQAPAQAEASATPSATQEQQPPEAAAAMEFEQQGARATSKGSAEISAGVSEGASLAQAAVQQQILGAVLEECLFNTRAEVGW